MSHVRNWAIAIGLATLVARPAVCNDPPASPWTQSANFIQTPYSSPVGVPPAPATSSPGLDGDPLSLPPADSSGPILTLEELESIALQNNPSLASAQSRVMSAHGQRIQAGLYPNTVIGYQGMEMGNQGTPGQQGGFVSQRFITGGKLRLDQAIASKQIDASQSLFYAQQQRVLTDVRTWFYDTLVAQQRVELTRKLVAVGNEVVQSTQKLFDGEQVSETNLLQAEIELEQAMILYDNSRNQNVETWRRLAAVAGLSSLEMGVVSGDLATGIPRYTWDECYQMVLELSPQLAAARARVDGARISVERAHRENIPNIDLMVGIRHIYPSDSDTASVDVGIPIPILNRNQGNILQAQANVIGTQKELERIQLDLQSQLAMAYRRYANALQQMDRYAERILPRSARALELTTQAYAQDQVDYLTVLLNQRTYFQVNLAYLDSAQELREAIAAIEGQLLSGSLSMPP